MCDALVRILHASVHEGLVLSRFAEGRHPSGDTSDLIILSVPQSTGSMLQFNLCELSEAVTQLYEGDTLTRVVVSMPTPKDLAICITRECVNVEDHLVPHIELAPAPRKRARDPEDAEASTKAPGKGRGLGSLVPHRAKAVWQTVANIVNASAYTDSAMSAFGIERKLVAELGDSVDPALADLLNTCYVPVVLHKPMETICDELDACMTTAVASGCGRPYSVRANVTYLMDDPAKRLDCGCVDFVHNVRDKPVDILRLYRDSRAWRADASYMGIHVRYLYRDGCIVARVQRRQCAEHSREGIV